VSGVTGVDGDRVLTAADLPVLVVRDQRATGWSGEELDEAGCLISSDEKRNGVKLPWFQVVPFLEAAALEYSTDAHLIPYYPVERETGEIMGACPRINKKALESERVDFDLRFPLVLMDLDDPSSHGKGGLPEARELWRMDQRALLATLPEGLASGCAWYDTKRGMRIVWRLSEPVDAATFEALGRKTRAAVIGHGLDVDDLKDWTRLYRLPGATRKGSEAPDRYDRDLDEMLGEDEPPVDVEAWVGWQTPMDDGKRASDARETVAKGMSAGEPVRGGRLFAGIGRAGGLKLKVGDRFPQGRRNPLMLAHGGKLRNYGMNDDEITAVLEMLNQTRCDPPMDDDDLEDVIRRVHGYEIGSNMAEVLSGVWGREGVGEDPDSEVTVDPMERGDQAEAALVWLDQIHPERGNLIFDRGALWKYKAARGVWGKLDPHWMTEKARTLAGYPVICGTNKDGTPKIKPLRMDLSSVAGTVKLGQSRCARDGWFAAAEPGIACSEGFLAVEDGELVIRDHSPLNRATFAIDGVIDPEAIPHLWIHALGGMFAPDDDAKEKIQIMGEFLGACLMGEATRYQKALVLVGDGANGKSVILSVISALFPGDSVTAIAPQGMESEYRRALLANSRLNVVTEMPDSEVLESGPVKAILTGDMIDARAIRQDPFQYRPRAGHALACNILPPVRDTSRGFWRRWIVLPFNRVFEEHEQDRGLTERILASERTQIVAWALRCYLELAKRGKYDPPKSSVMALAEWRTDANSVSAFVEEECQMVPRKDGMTATELHKCFQIFCQEAGYRPLGRSTFGKRLKASGYEIKPYLGRRTWPLKAKNNPLTKITARL